MLRHRKQLTFYRICLLLLPITIQGQLFNEFKNRELSDHFFGLSYFPASWQSSVFEEDLYTSSSYQHEVQFSKLSNALRLNYSGAEKMLSQFKEDFPSSIAARTIDLDVANYYFQNEKYRYALKWYQKISENEVPKKDRPLYNFNKGYTLFSAKNYKKAKPYLEKVKDHKTYESDAHYFLGHIAYQLEDFDSALTSFSSISNPIQKENLLYFQADMNFRLGRFDQAITLSKEALKQANNEEASELSKIIGESYFNLQSYSDAIPFLEAYEGKKGTWENSDYYQLGYAYFKQQNFDKAIGQFNRIIGNKNEMAQNAYYALAECYLNTNQKSAALNAFKSASAMNFNPIIKEDAFLNYAKLSHEIGNPYEASSKVLVAFLETYPKNEHVILIEKLLIESYTKSKNYSAALEILENNSGFKNNETLQRVLILSAIQEYQKGSYAKASALFQRGLKLKENKTLEAFGLYWYGRSEYERNLFDNALDLFKQFRSHPKKENVEAAIQLNYDLGYVYFKLGEYQDALRSFEAFNEENSALDVSYQRDTFLRMGDCQFALKQYWPAMEHYNTSIAFAPRKGAYASFQKAISYGFVDRNPKKIEALNTFILQYPNDPLVDDVLFELASAYSSTSDAQQAIDTYDRLLTRFENSPYLAKAALNKGLILFNQEDYKTSKSVLEEVALTYQRYSVGEQALRTLKEIAIEEGTVNAFARWVKDQKLDTFTDIELEKSAFNAAERQFLEGNTSAALKLLEEYKQTYPEGAFSKVATYYLAEIYFDKERPEEALVAYQSLLEDPQVSTYSEKALTRVIILLKNKNLEIEAIPYMEQLAVVASFEENKKFAMLNLMQAYYANRQFKRALETAEAVLNLNEIEAVVEWDALKLKARSSIALGDSLNAADAYLKLEKAPQAAVVAEALYFRAERMHRENDFTTSNELIGKIAENSGQSGEWNVKALLLLAKNYYALSDAFQAVFVLETIIENFDSYPLIVEEAAELIEQYRASLGEENRSITKDTTNE
jgi:tetratricopeptide (TPR) repeat protein